MTVKRDESRVAVFVMKPDNLTDMNNRLVNEGFTPKFEIICANGMGKTFNNVSELLTFENRPAQDIEQLIVTGQSVNSIFGFDFRNERSKNVSLYFEGDDLKGEKILEIFGDALTSTKPWYDYAARIGIVNIAILNVILMIIAVSAASFIKNGHFRNLAVFFSAPLLYLMYVYPFLFFLFIANLKARLTERIEYFPMGVFAIKQGEHRHTQAENWRTVIIFGLMIGIIGGIITGFIFI